MFAEMARCDVEPPEPGLAETGHRDGHRTARRKGNEVGSPAGGDGDEAGPLSRRAAGKIDDEHGTDSKLAADNSDSTEISRDKPAPCCQSEHDLHYERDEEGSGMTEPELGDRAKPAASQPPGRAADDRSDGKQEHGAS